MKKYLLLFLCITLWLGVLVGLRGFAATEASVPAGSVRVRTENGILELELEEYVAALLSAAMPDNYPEEALRAQAVILRTRTCRTLESGVPHEDGCFCAGCEYCFSFTTTVTAASHNAARATAGEVLRYNGTLIDARFHLSSCEYTASAYELTGEDIPYLVSVDTPDESGFSAFVNTVTIPLDQLAAAFPDRTLSFEANDLYLSYYDSGRIKNVFFGDTAVAGGALATAFALKSQRFDAAIRDGALVITTYGYGDGLGLSQYGAYLLAQSGQTYKDILLHYYRSVEISEI